MMNTRSTALPSLHLRRIRRKLQKRPGHPGLLKPQSRPSERGIFPALGQHAKRILRKGPPAFNPERVFLDAIEDDLDLAKHRAGNGTNRKAASERSDGL
jgi:hypothetical protein